MRRRILILILMAGSVVFFEGSIEAVFHE